MSIRPRIRCEWQSPTASFPHSISTIPRKLVIRSGFGAMKRTCFLELYQEDLHIPFQLGDTLRVWVNQVDCFFGIISQIRIDSIDDPITLVAEQTPARILEGPVHGQWEDTAAHVWLKEVAPSFGLAYTPTHVSTRKLQAIQFAGQSMLFALDLWAKLAGNWRWDVSDFGELRFRPWRPIPEHQEHLHHDHDTINIRRTTFDRFEWVTLHAGVIKGNEQTRIVHTPGNRGRSESARTTAYARPVVSSDGLFLLREAVHMQQASEMVTHTIDLDARGVTIRPGDTIRFTMDSFEPFLRHLVFRVKQREITVAHERLTTRLHLTTGYENAYRYFEYMRSDPRLVPGIQEGSRGPFQLDVSALDSEAHLDAA